MEKFVRRTAKACPAAPGQCRHRSDLAGALILKLPRSPELGRVLFGDLRRDADGSDRPDFPLNGRPGAMPDPRRRPQLWRRLVARSRRLRALSRRFSCVIAPSFGDIFAQNSVKNGLLTAVLSETDVSELGASDRRRSGNARHCRSGAADDRARQSQLCIHHRSGQPQSIAATAGRTST